MNNSNTESPKDYCYTIAHNILINDDEAASCVQNALNSMPSISSANPSLYLVRRVRFLAFDIYMTTHADKTSINEMTLILDELNECLTNTSISNKEENVIALQLSNILDSFSRRLPEQDCNIFIRRYFYADSIKDIAMRYNKAENSIITTLSICRNLLKKHINDNGYIIKVETLFSSFTDINDDILGQSEMTSTKAKKKWLIPASIVAGLLLVTVVSIVIMTNDSNDDKAGILPSIEINPPEYDFNDFFDNPTPPAIELPIEPAYKIGGKVDIDALLDFAYDTDEYPSTLTVSFSFASEYTLVYKDCGVIGKDILSDCICPVTIHGFGGEDDPYEYYFLDGHTNVEYMITVHNGQYTLWQYDYAMVSAEYKNNYSFILDNVYGINSADDIQMITVAPVNNDASEELQIKNYSDISYIHHVLSLMNCDNNTPWDVLEDTECTFYEAQKNAYKLTITTTDGAVIDHLYYSGLGGHFYTKGGFAFDKVSDNAYNELNDIICFAD